MKYLALNTGARIPTLDMGDTGSRAKRFEPDFVRICLGKN